MVIPTSMMFEGQELAIWNHDQLSKLNTPALRTRAINLRDIVGKDRLPSLPGHPEGIIKWIIEVQVAVGQGSGSDLTAQDYGMPKDADAPPSAAPSSAGGRGRRDPAEGNQAPSETGEASDAFNEARAARELAKERNRGTGIF
mmetsp:Transcript_95516/g.204977  ORF Transcript_95516/g.204977 Transcript_95516/m.204977 type:complete len:143 (+) Transcript_95516:74-502(+)